MYLLGNLLGAFGFSIFFGGTLIDGLCAGICGILIGLTDRFLGKFQTNPFFRTIANSFIMTIMACIAGIVGIADNTDTVIIGALMILVPGLIFTNAMRDIIYGDTNSGINRLVQVLLIAAAIVVATAAAWNCAAALWGMPTGSGLAVYSLPEQWLPCMLACIGFGVLFNIHGPGGLLCALGGTIAWGTYLLVFRLTNNDLAAYFWAAMVASLYSEIMARIRKYPAISYLVISIFPIIPGAGAYYTMNYAVQGEMELFASKGMFTAAIAGVMAVGILLGSSVFRMYSDWKQHKK
jgi:uncharacterized membrane protein YjjB (DUF3815 family)